MSALANVDGVVSPEEVKLLEQVYRTLELEPQILYSHLHGGGVKQWQSGPPSVSSDTSARSSSFLDARRIIELRQETDVVTELLAGVFVEEEADTTHPRQRTEVPKEDNSLAVSARLPGLDMAHDKFLSLLLRKPVRNAVICPEAVRRSNIGRPRGNHLGDPFALLLADLCGCRCKKNSPVTFAPASSLWQASLRDPAESTALPLWDSHLRIKQSTFRTSFLAISNWLRYVQSVSLRRRV